MSTPTKVPGTPTEVDPIYLLTALVKLETQMLSLSETIVVLKETNEGTLRTKGMKEKIAVAEQNIDANKAAFLHLQQSQSDFFDSVNKKFDDQTSELMKAIGESKTSLSKMQPWFNVITWVVTAAAGILLSMLLSGNLQIVHP